MVRSISGLFLLIFSFRLSAECLPVDEDDPRLQQSGITIGAVEFSRYNVFDLTEKGIFWLHHFANYSHVITTEQTVADDLLFTTGEKLDNAVLAETERLLRGRRYIREADVSVSHYCDQNNTVVVHVSTWDNWSLLPNLDFSSEGGETDYAIGISEDNLLGTGNQLQLDYNKDNERSGYLLSFASPNVFGTHWNTLTRYENNSDGEGYHFTLTRPFYRLSSPWAFSLDLERSKEKLTDYLLGETVNEYDSKLKWFESELGIKLAQQGNRIHRLNVGLTLEDRTFEAIDETFYNLPDARNLSAIWIEYQLLEADYRKLFNINQFNRTEDINLGWQASFRVGHLQHWLGADQSGWLIKAQLDKVWQLHPDLWFLAQTAYHSLWLSERHRRLLSTHLQLVYQINPSSSLVGILDAELGNNLFMDEALYLGGDTGMRAYPLHYQRGDSRVIATAEYRYYTKWSILQLLDVAFAGFADAGRSWGAEQEFSSPVDDKILFGIGTGVRLLSTHSSRGIMIHLDVAHPISNNPELDTLQWRVTAKHRF
ncbi:BamA/TamA family outer membrane protein [Chromatiaceae bacterium AAb-1]|nr:BamA/TamA family outer membrane protein [Chromatiaceae bacterium AAb-1]